LLRFCQRWHLCPKAGKTGALQLGGDEVRRLRQLPRTPAHVSLADLIREMSDTPAKLRCELQKPVVRRRQRTPVRLAGDSHCAARRRDAIQ